MHKYNTPLEARVAAQNRVNKEATRLQEILFKVFAPFVGKKILLVTGELTKQVKAEMPKASEGFQFYKDSSNYRLAFTLRCHESVAREGGYERTYDAEATIQVGVYEDHSYVLKELSPPYNFKTDYDAEEVAGLRKFAESKEAEARNAEYALSPFGRYDR